MEACASIYFLLLAKILKKELQLLTCKEYTTLYCAERQSKTVGYFAVFEARDMHQERDAVIAWQLIYNTIYLLAVVAVFRYVIFKFFRLVYVK